MGPGTRTDTRTAARRNPSRRFRARTWSISGSRIFSGRRGPARYGKHQTGVIKAAAGKAIRRVEGWEARSTGAGFAGDNGRQADSCGPSGSAADDAGVLLDGVGEIDAGLRARGSDEHGSGRTILKPHQHELREAHGYTYGAGSFFNYHRSAGPFVVFRMCGQTRPLPRLRKCSTNCGGCAKRR